MKQYLFILVFLSTILFANSQINMGRVVYEVNINRLLEDIKERKKTNPSFNGNIFNKVGELATEMQLELIFVNQRAVFKPIKSLGVDYQEITRALAMRLLSGGMYFTDLEKGVQINLKEFEGEIIKTESKINNISDWKLLNETKKIGDFVCFKAEMIKTVPKGDVIITAWYAPSIPLSLGPKEYVGNLPGLILEMEGLVGSFRCTSINLNPQQEISLDWPDNTGTLTTEEYNKLEGEVVKKIKNRGN